MNERQLQEAWEIFRTARDLPAEQLHSFLASVDTDPDILREVVSMLEELRDPPSKEGTSFGRYEVLGILGSGGMGQVYAARDPELGRTIAIKFLTPDLAASAPAVDRLLREAKAASALNHPNIVTVYEVIRDSENVGIAMEFVDGDSLRSFCREPQAISKVVQWGSQIARALAAAHARNIIHHDIKPENLMTRPDGLLKVLDFGLARHAGPGLSANSSMTFAGTLNYMAPERTRGESATTASDVFSLGLVLYELATGSHPFAADSPIDTAHAIAHSQPAPLNRNLPDAFHRLLLEMLDKDPSKRPSSEEVERRLSAVLAIPAPDQSQLRCRIAAVVALCLLAAIATVWFLRGPVALPILDKLPGSATALKIVPFTSLEGSEADPSFSPDGREIAFSWNRNGTSNIYVKSIGQDQPRRLTAGVGPDENPVWSPDGRSIAFLRGAPTSKVALMIMPASGGNERKAGEIEDTLGYPGPISWTADGKGLIVRDIGPKQVELFQVSLETGKRTPLAISKLGGRFALSPDGLQLAYERLADMSDRVRVCVLTLASRTDKCLLQTLNDTHMAWMPGSKTLLLTNNLGLWRQSVSGGSPVKLADGKFDGLVADRQGRRLAFTRRYSDSSIWQLRTDGKPTSKFIASSLDESEPEYSPDGNRILFRSNRSGNYELWVAAKDGSNSSQLTHLGGHLGSARWSPDGSQIVFDASAAGTRNVGIWVVPAAGGRARRLTPPDMAALVPAWSQDGRWVYFSRSEGTWKIPIEGGDPVLVTMGETLDLNESADGKLLYFRKGRAIPGIWRQPVFGGEPALVQGTESVMSRYWQLSKDGIYFVDSSGLEFLDFATSRVRRLAAVAAGLVVGPRGMTVSPDGRSILYTREDLTFSDIMLVEDFH